MSSERGFWLVGSSGNLPSGKPAQVVFADAKPTGYGYTHFLGNFTLSQKKQFEAALAQALVSLPTGIAIPSQLNVPYFGQVSMPGPGGIAGAIDQTVTTAGDVATKALSLTSLFGSTSLWAGIGMALLGAVLVLFGIVKLSGADPKTLAKRMMK